MKEIQKQQDIPDIMERINMIISEKQERISTTKMAIDENSRLLDEAKAEADTALASGDENAYVLAKQKAAEAAARLEFNQKRLITIQARGENPESKEIMKAALESCVSAYRKHAERCLALIDELTAESDAAGAKVANYERMRARWHDNIDNETFYPDFPNQSAARLDQNLNFARNNLAAYLGKN